MKTMHLNIYEGEVIETFYEPREFVPNQPRASMRVQATVGVGGAVNPMKDRLRPSDLKLDTRGVGAMGEG